MDAATRSFECSELGTIFVTVVGHGHVDRDAALACGFKCTDDDGGAHLFVFKQYRAFCVADDGDHVGLGRGWGPDKVAASIDRGVATARLVAEVARSLGSAAGCAGSIVGVEG